MKAYVINLPEAESRLAHMREVLAGIGLPFERFEALNPARAALHPCFAQIPPMKERNWVPGEIAIILSHFEVWRLIANGEEKFGMVLEDDLVVDPALARVLNGSCPIPEDADLIKLDSGQHTLVALSRRSMATPDGFAWHRLRSLHYGGAAYLISRPAARKLMESIALFDMPVDDALFTPGHRVGRMLRVWQAVPVLAIQHLNLPPERQVPEPGEGMNGLRAEERARSLRKRSARDVVLYPWRLLRNHVLIRFFHLYAPPRVIPFGVPRR